MLNCSGSRFWELPISIQAIAPFKNTNTNTIWHMNVWRCDLKTWVYAFISCFFSFCFQHEFSLIFSERMWMKTHLYRQFKDTPLEKKVLRYKFLFCGCGFISVWMDATRLQGRMSKSMRTKAVARKHNIQFDCIYNKLLNSAQHQRPDARVEFHFGWIFQLSLNLTHFQRQRGSPFSQNKQKHSIVLSMWKMSSIPMIDENIHS